MTIHEIKETERVRATIEDGALVLERFTEPDPVVVQMLTETEDLVIGVHTLLQLGALTMRAGRGALDEVLVGQSFARLGEQMDAAVEAGAGLIAETASGLLDAEDGELSKVLADLRTELESKFAALFDPDSKSSALALLEDVFTTAVKRTEAARWAQLDPDDEHSALGRWRAAQSKEFKEAIAEVLKAVRDLELAHAVEEAEADVFALTTLKGMVYEDVVHLAFSSAVASHSDVIEDVSRARGAAGSMVGDLAIHLNPEECGGDSPTVVLEAKSKRMGLRKTLSELDSALANREASAAIAVFSSRELAPIPSVFVTYGDKAILVLDNDLPDIGAVELAMEWGRWVARRSASVDTESFDYERFVENVARASRALERASTIRRAHSTIRRGVDQASSELDDLVAEIRAALAELKDMAAG